MNKNLTIKQNTSLTLEKADSSLGITKKILSTTSILRPINIEQWMETLWDWADDNNISDLEWIERYGGYYSGIPRDKNLLLNLTQLYLCGYKIREVPKEIGNLTSLKTLELWINNLTFLPKEIANLTNLTELDLWSNKLDELPKEITNLTNLTSLNLSSHLQITRKATNFVVNVVKKVEI